MYSIFCCSLIFSRAYALYVLNVLFVRSGYRFYCLSRGVIKVTIATALVRDVFSDAILCRFRQPGNYILLLFIERCYKYSTDGTTSLPIPLTTDIQRYLLKYDIAQTIFMTNFLHFNIIYINRNVIL